MIDFVEQTNLTIYRHMLNRTSRTVEPTKEKSVAEKQAEEIEEAKEARAQFVRKGKYFLFVG